MPDRVASVDVANHELFAALREPGCPMCRVLADADRRAVRSFVAEGHRDSGVREAFIDAGGFCSHHAHALLDESEDVGTGAVIADIYGKVADRDLAALQQPSKARGRRGTPPTTLPAPGRCYLCVAHAATGRRQAHFMLGLLSDEAARSRYGDSDGVCRQHLALVVTQARAKRRQAPLGDWLLEEWRERLEQLRRTLAEYDRKRDYRFARQRTVQEQRSWRDVIRLYAGGANGR